MRGIGTPVGVVLMGLLGCGDKQSEQAARERAPAPGPGPGPVDPGKPSPPLAPAAPPAFPETTRSLEMIKTTAVRLEPTDEAKRIGTIAIDTRVAWSSTAPGKGCKKPWVEIRPRGWVCSDYMKPSTRPPFGREVPMLDRGELVPGIYGKVTAPSSVTYVAAKPEKKKGKEKKSRERAPRTGPITSPDQVGASPSGPKLVEGRPLVGSINVRQYGEISVDGKQFWKISQRDPEYVLSRAIRQHRPSEYGGARLGDETGWGIPVAFVWPRVTGWRSSWVTYKPQGGGVIRQVPARTPLPILETFTNPQGKVTAYRVGEAEWISALDVRLFAASPERPISLRDNERWIDVDLDNQILVAFEGDVPVYTTMISSGSKDYPTETGIYRMWLKESEADMKGLNGEDPYSVATVPWTQFYSPEKGLALHTAYWHDQFGVRRSRGCLNMAPRDARWLYFWSEPQVPPGWTMAAGVVEAPGSLVRVRSKADPSPPLRGYAKKVHELQQASTPQ